MTTPPPEGPGTPPGDAPGLPVDGGGPDVQGGGVGDGGGPDVHARTASEGAPPPGARWPRLLLQLLVTGVVTWFILDRVGFTLDELGSVDLGRWRPRWMHLAASVGLLAAGYAMSAWLWGRMVGEMGGPRLPLFTTVRIYMVANLGRYVPGKVVQIAGLAWLARAEGVAPGTAMAAAVVGQGVALLGAAVVGLGAFFGTTESYRWVGWIGVGVTALFIAATSFPASAQFLERLWRRLAGRGRAGEGATEPSSDPAARPGFGLRWTGWYTLNWGLYAAAFWLLYQGLEGWMPFLQVGPAFAAAYLVGYLFVLAPAGVGIRESALVVFLLPVMPRDAALALAVAARLWTTVVELIPAAILAGVRPRRGSTPESSRPSGP